MSVSNGSTPYQTLSYTYENFGNLRTRHTTVGGGTLETFTYDALQRLTMSIRNYPGSSGTVTYTYDASGSFQSKSDFASNYTYDSNRPHVIASAGSATYDRINR